MEPEEIQLPWFPRAGRRSTTTERAAQDATGHAVFRSWREACGMARGLGQQHRHGDGGRPDEDCILGEAASVDDNCVGMVLFQSFKR